MFRNADGLNPEYSVIALDASAIGEYLDIPSEIRIDRPDITVQKISNLVRIGLLATRGGVWADATLMCSKPLRNWLPEYYSTGFFAFRNSNRDRMFSNWFMVSEAENILTRKLYDDYASFLSTNYFTNQRNILGLIFRGIFGKFWNRNVKATTNWRSDFAQKVLKTYPYFIFHYTFNEIILEDADCRYIWENAKPFEVNGQPQRIQVLSRQGESTQQALEFISSNKPPVHKLNWRADMNVEFWKEVLSAFKSVRQYQDNNVY